MRTAAKVNISLGVVLIGLVVTALLAFHQPNVRVTVLDPRMHVLSAKILRGSNVDFYIGSQLEGRVRDFLGGRMHLNVTPLHNFGRSYFFGKPYQKNTTGQLALLFRWDASEAPPKHIIAEFVDSAGKAKQLPSASRSGNPFCCIVDLGPLLPNSGSYRLRFRVVELDDANRRMVLGTNLAEVEIREMLPLSPKP